MVSEGGRNWDNFSHLCMVSERTRGLSLAHVESELPSFFGVRSPPASHAPPAGHGRPMTTALPPSLCSHEIWRGRKWNAVVSEGGGGNRGNFSHLFMVSERRSVKEQGVSDGPVHSEVGTILFCASRIVRSKDRTQHVR